GLGGQRDGTERQDLAQRSNLCHLETQRVVGQPRKIPSPGPIPRGAPDHSPSGQHLLRYNILAAPAEVRAMPYTLTINGTTSTVDVPGDMPLLWVLRDVLDLKGTKFGCGMAQCGACTVHVAGAATRSCVLPVSAVGASPITTIEGLSPGAMHPLQLAWQELDVPQCGYCQAGQLMSAAALLARTPQPTEADIDAAMNGNICRCNTYLRIRQAIRRAAGHSAAGSAVRPKTGKSGAV
ncbi:MAG: (2Fe-2S)-binding protein, partial [Gemmatimonadales bacterium]